LCASWQRTEGHQREQNGFSHCRPLILRSLFDLHLYDAQDRGRR
jgi:hypothetical protein